MSDSKNDGKIPLLDLRAQYAEIRDEVQDAVLRTLDSQQFILGPEVAALENEVADYCQTEHAIGVSSGTDALLVSLMALGIGRGDEVILPAYSFFATAGSIVRLGATPIFADILPACFNIDPEAVERLITPKTRAIVPVHLFGQMAEMDALAEIAARHRIPIVEDAAQAIGSEYHSRRAGSIGAVGCFSFFPSKNLGGAGDGGMVTTNDAELAERVRMLRMHGFASKYDSRTIGGNFRLDAIQAAVLRVKLRHLDRWTEARQFNASTYRRCLESQPANRSVPITAPVELPNRRHIYNQFVVRIGEGQRDHVTSALRAEQIGCAVYYPKTLPQQECFAGMGNVDAGFPVSEQAAADTLAVPIFSELPQQAIERVVGVLRSSTQIERRSAA